MTTPNPETRPPLPGLGADEARVVDALLASMARSRRQGEAGLKLGEADGAPEPLRAGDEVRAARVSSLFALLARCPADDPPAHLTRRTMDRIADDRRRRWFAEQAQVLAGPRVGMTWREVAAVAAILVVGFSLLFPMVGRMREDARRIACAGNLQAAGMALGHYAADNGDALPRRASYAGQPWWNVGKQSGEDEPVQSNSAHTYLLVRQGYADADTLNCPDNPHAVRGLTREMNDWPSAAAVGYSTQNQFGQPIKISQVAGKSLALMADKNPLFGGQARPGAPMRFRQSLAPNSPSIFHRARGQNILMLHGGVVWSARPILSNGDNIWLANGVDHYTGTETPTSLFDSFLVP
jgi:hypothetical protein